MILPEAILGGDDQPRVQVRKATFTGIVDKFAQVDMGDSRFVCDFGSGYIPQVGESVRMWTLGDQHLMFPAGPHPTVGTVLTVSGAYASVDTLTGQITVTYDGEAPASGEIVGIVWSENGPWCSPRLSSTPALPPTPAPPPDPGGDTAVVRSATFRAIDAGSIDRGQARWWQAQPWASSSTYGVWFYGSQIKDTIPPGAQLVSMEFFVSWQQRQGDAPDFGLRFSPFKAEVPNMVGVSEWDPGAGWQPLSYATDWFPNLIAGGAHYGIGLNQGGWNQFSSLAQDSMSGALRIAWRS